MTVELDPDHLRQFCEGLARGTTVRISKSEIWDRFVEAFPGRPRGRRERAWLCEALQQARDRVEHMEEVAAEPLRLDKANKELNEKVSALRTELDQAQAQTAMLRDDKTSQQWAMGAGILILGGILGWIFKARGNRGRGSWMN